MKVYIDTYATDVGTFTIAASDELLYWLGLPGNNELSAKAWISRHIPDAENVLGPNRITEKTKEWIQMYLKGKAMLPIVPYTLIGTTFQQKVWKKIGEIPYGKNLSYKQIAEEIGSPKAVRAVGTACGSNPIPLLIACHRVLASNGKLGGYGGGLPLKKLLLQLEATPAQ